MLFKAIEDKKGLTLIEVLISLAIMGIVLAAASSLHIFGLKSFNRGEERYNLQSGLRETARNVADTVRIAEDVEILAQKPAAATFEMDKKYIYIDSTSGKSVVKLYKGGVITNISGEIEGTVSLSFNRGSSGKILAYNISGESKTQKFTEESEVFIQNIKGGNITLPVSDPGPWKALKFGPLTIGEVVGADKTLLSLGDLTSVTNNISLPTSGQNGSAISWTSSNNAIIDGTGLVTRPGITCPDADATLTAAIKYGAEIDGIAAKAFQVHVLHRTEVQFQTPVLVNGTAGQTYSFIFNASGGYDVYNFTVASGSLPSGLTLSDEGILSGTPTIDGTCSFRIKVLDINNTEAGTRNEIISDLITLTITPV